MKKGIIVGMVSLILLTSCGTYTSTRASLGGILGSAIGGIAGGGRGSDIGTIIGMAGGAIIGAAADNRVQQRERQEVHDHYERVMQNKEHGYNSYNGISLDTDDMYSNITSEPFSRVSPSTDPSGFDSLNTGDDRLYDCGWTVHAAARADSELRFDHADGAVLRRDVRAQAAKAKAWQKSGPAKARSG